MTLSPVDLRLLTQLAIPCALCGKPALPLVASTDMWECGSCNHITLQESAPHHVMRGADGRLWQQPLAPG